MNKEALLFQTMRDTQGLHAPLRLQMERRIVSRVSYHLSFMLDREATALLVAAVKR